MSFFKTVASTCILLSIISTTAFSAVETGLTQTEINQINNVIEAIQKNYIASVNDDTLVKNALTGMVTKLDPHSAFLDKKELSNLETTVSGEFVGIGIELTTERGMLRVIAPIDGSPAEKAGLKPGDLIIKIDNKLIQDMTVGEAIDEIKGKPGTAVTLTIIRKNESKPLVLNITRQVIKVQAVKAKLLAPGYGYIRLSVFQGPVGSEVRNAIEKFKSESDGKLNGLILDLRNNPGGLLDASADVVNLFLDKNETKKYNDMIVYTKGRIPNADVSYKAKDEDMIPGVPMVVLINGGSASASEIVAGALQDYKRAVIMGTRSFGKGSVQTIIPIGSEDALKLTTALYFTPSGREIQARGIEPDVIVPELAVNEKEMTGLLDIDEANYDHHIKNEVNDGYEKKSIDAERKAQQKKLLSLAKDDYQLYEAVMLLKGLHALK